MGNQQLRRAISCMVAAMVCGTAAPALAGAVGVLNGLSHDAQSAAFTESGLADLGVNLLLAPGDPFGSEPETRPTVVLLRGYDFPEGAVDKVTAHVAAGGKVILVGPVADEITEALGLTQQPVSMADAAPDFVVPLADALLGAPERAAQRPSLLVSYIHEAAQPLALWEAGGTTIADTPAVVELPFGAALGWEPQPSTSHRMAWLLAAILGRLDPEIMASVAQKAELSFGRVGRLPSWAESQPYLSRKAGASPAASEALNRATASYGTAIGALQAEDWPTLLVSAMVAQEALAEAYAKCFPSRPGEVRAVWCAAAQSSWPATLDRLATSNINAIFLEASTATTAQYASQSLITPSGNPDFAGIIEQAHAVGLDVHAWHAMLALHDAPPDEIERYKQEDRVQVSDDGAQLPWLCPSDPRNREQVIETITELVSQYNLEGIVLDYVRYATERECYCPSCRTRFEEQIGIKIASWPDDALRGLFRTRYQAFREAQIADLIRSVAAAVKALAPDLIVSVTVAPSPQATPLGHGAYASWLTDGTVDMVCALDYGTGVAGLAAQVSAQARAIAGQALLCVGLAADPRGGAPMDGATTLEAIAACREGGADGVALFRCGDNLLSDALPTIAVGAMSTPTVAPYAMVGAAFEFPAEPLHDDYPGAYTAGDPLEIIMDLPPGTDIATLSPTLEALATGETTELPPAVSHEDGRSALALSTPEGRYRISVSLPLASGEEAVVRSQVFEGVSPSRMAALQDEVARARRIDVAVLRDAVGADAIRRFLDDSADDISADFVSGLTREDLAPFDVLVVCDVRAPRDLLTEEAMQAIRDFAMEGNGVLLLHDAVGSGGLPVMFPSIGGPLGNARSTYREVTISSERHPAIDGLGAGQRFRPEYGDHVMLQRGALGVPLISEDAVADPDAGTLIVGDLQRGRVALCGLGLGLRGDSTNKEEAAPRQKEADLLINLIAWLGEPSLQKQAPGSLRIEEETPPSPFPGFPAPTEPTGPTPDGLPDPVPDELPGPDDALPQEEAP